MDGNLRDLYPVHAHSGAKNFLKNLSDYFFANYDQSGKIDTWWIDQNALFYANRQADTSGNCRLTKINDSALDRCIEANLPMESKFQFANRIKNAFPLAAIVHRKPFRYFGLKAKHSRSTGRFSARI